jgi:hypothetical protein
MLQLNCRHCGQPNPDIARVCRYCGQALQPDADAPRAGYAEPPPRTGAYVPTHDWASSAPLPAAPTYAAPQPALSTANFQCPFCQTTRLPVVATRISTGGWIVFAALIIACFPLCFIGLFIKEEYRMCSWCRAALS